MKKSGHNVAHRKQRLPVLPLLQRDVSFAAHELVQHRAHLCRHLFTTRAKKDGAGAFLFGKGRVKSVKEGLFLTMTEKILLSFRRRFIFFFSSSKARLLRVFRFLPFETEDTTRRRDTLCLYLYLSLYLSIYLSLLFPLFPILSSDRFGLRVVGRGMGRPAEQRRSAVRRWRRAAFPSSLRIVYRPLLLARSLDLMQLTRDFG